MRVALALLLAACAVDEPLADDYDASCAAPADCAPVVDRGFCGACSGWVALSADGAAAFAEDQQAYADRVRCRETILIGCPDLPPPPEVACGAAGSCEIAP